MNPTTIYNNSAKEKANRIKILRAMLNISAKEFCEKHNIPLPTLKCWEAASQTGLTAKGALRIIQAVNKEGIECSIEWLLYGEGTPPKLIHTEAQDLSKENEIKQFYNSYKDSVILNIEDNAMTPVYIQQDVIGGIWQYGNDIKELNQQHCIIETPDHHLACRKLVCTNKPQIYNCYALNPEAPVEHVIISNIKLAKAAPVLRLWRDLPSKLRGSLK